MDTVMESVVVADALLSPVSVLESVYNSVTETDSTVTEGSSEKLVVEVPVMEKESVN